MKLEFEKGFFFFFKLQSIFLRAKPVDPKILFAVFFFFLDLAAARVFYEFHSNTFCSFRQ